MEFQERNISKNPAYIRELTERGHRGTPVTVIDQDEIVGFDRGTIQRKLGLQ